MAAATPEGGERSHRGSRARIPFLALAGVLSLLLSSGSAFAIYGILYVDEQLTKQDSGAGCRQEGCLRDVLRQECDDEPCAFLLLGSDSRAGLSRRERREFGTGPDAVQGQRADTVVLVHTDPRIDRTVVLHFPRDLRVTIPGYGVGRINSAFEHGPNVVVQTVTRLTGIRINHYVQVNFAGFRSLVDALGGIPMCVDRPMHDRLAGLKLPRAGCYDLDGRQALAFVRARHVEGDVIPDFSRISRQQQFMRAVIERLLSVGAVLDFGRIANAVGENVVVDKHLNPYELQALTRRLSGLGQGGVDFRVVPSVPTNIGGVEYVVTKPSARVLFERLRTGGRLHGLGREQALTRPSPATIRVKVIDAGAGDAAVDVVRYLRRAGFEVLPTEPAEPGAGESAILYLGSAAERKDVVASFVPDVRVLRDDDAVEASGADVVVVVGPDFPPVEF